MSLSHAIHFAQFIVTSQVFYTSRLCAALVNLKPLLPGHSLVIPRRIVPRYADLSSDEVTDLFIRHNIHVTHSYAYSVQKVGSVLQKAYHSTSLTIVIQDGTDAGQSVPHVHVHIIPRRKQDYEENDEIYNDLEKSERNLGKTFSRTFPKLEDKERTSRTEENMATEATWLANFFDK